MYPPEFYKDCAKAVWWIACGVGAGMLSGTLALALTLCNDWDLWSGILVVTSMGSGIHTVASTMKKSFP